MNIKQRYKDELAALQPRRGSILARAESGLARLAPGAMLRREQTRQKLAQFRAQGAYSNRGRENAPWGQTGETYINQRERKQKMWNACELVQNSGLAESITSKLADYTYGQLRYQARTGEGGVNSEYEAYMREKCGSCLDLSGRHSLRTMMHLSMRGAVVKGGMGHAFIRLDEDDPNLYLQSYEYDRIGGLFSVPAFQGYVDGIWTDPVTGREAAISLYERDRIGGMYRFQRKCDVYDWLGRRQFLHFFKPSDTDQYKGETAFGQVIDLIHYVDDMRKHELAAMQLAATQGILYFNKDGTIPTAGNVLNDNTTEVTDKMGQKRLLYNVYGTQVTAMELGENAQMFQSERPSPNVLGAWANTVNEVCICTGLPMTFVYGQNQTGGPGVRFEGAQAARAIAVWWTLGEEKMLYPIGHGILENGIQNGDIPYHPRWREGVWIGPKSLTIDAGYETDKMLAERSEGVRTGAEICADNSTDIDQVRDTLTQEGNADIVKAKEIAQAAGETDWQKREVWSYYLTTFIRQGNGAAQGSAAIGNNKPLSEKPKGANDDPARQGATSDGATMPGDLGDTVRKLQADVIEIRSGRARSLSAFYGDVRYGDLPADVQADIKRFVPDVRAACRIPQLGMVVSELISKADAHNLDNARTQARKLTQAEAASTVNGTMEAGSKFALILNDRLVDGHHFVAKAEWGKVTAALPVLDLTSVRFQTRSAVRFFKLDNSGHEHADDGKFAKKGDGGSGDAQPAKKEKQNPNPKRNWIEKTPGIPEGSDTKQMHTDAATGGYTPERKALHQAISDKAFAGKTPVGPDHKPVAVVMYGGTASGKSTFTKGISGGNYVTVDADGVKGQLPEFQHAIDIHGAGEDAPEYTSARDAAGVVHEESSDVAKQIRDKAIAGNHNLIMDGTGANGEKYGKMIDGLKAKGYHIRIIGSTIHVDEAVKRAAKRANGSGRFVPEHFIRHAYGAIPGSFAQNKDKADEFQLYDNTAKEPVKIYEKTQGKEIAHVPESARQFGYNG